MKYRDEIPDAVFLLTGFNRMSWNSYSFSQNHHGFSRKITLNERKLILETFPFSTEPWLLEEGYICYTPEVFFWANLSGLWSNESWRYSKKQRFKKNLPRSLTVRPWKNGWLEDDYFPLGARDFFSGALAVKLPGSIFFLGGWIFQNIPSQSLT